MKHGVLNMSAVHYLPRLVSDKRLTTCWCKQSVMRINPPPPEGLLSVPCVTETPARAGCTGSSAFPGHCGLCAVTDVEPEPGLGGEHNGSHIASRSGLTHPVKREGASVNIFGFGFEMPCASDCQTVRSRCLAIKASR